MNWIDKILKKSTAIAAFNKEEDELIQKLIDKAIELHIKTNVDLGIIVAAFYDLAISSVYYTNITNTGWLYCDLKKPKLILPFVNCCPEHALKGEFVFHKSSKPTSAKIGQATTRILLLFLENYLNDSERILKYLRLLNQLMPFSIIREKEKCFLAKLNRLHY